MKPRLNESNEKKTKGPAFALVAAALFGLSTPLAKLLLGQLEPILLAALLYLGSGIGLATWLIFRHLLGDKDSREAGLKQSDLPWLGSAILAVFGVRMAGFACSVMTVKTPIAALVQYVMLFGVIGLSVWIIVGGVVVEPPPALVEAINRSNARLARLFRRPATA